VQLTGKGQAELAVGPQPTQIWPCITQDTSFLRVKGVFFLLYLKYIWIFKWIIQKKICVVMYHIYNYNPIRYYKILS
jgi:hypothetical protein